MSDVKLNKFQEARLIAARTMELVNGDKPKVKVPKEKKGRMLAKDYEKVAREEYDSGKLDLEIYN